MIYKAKIIYNKQFIIIYYIYLSQKRKFKKKEFYFVFKNKNQFFFTVKTSEINLVN